MSKHLKAYVCTTSIDTDLAMGAPDTTIYRTLRDLKSKRDCWKECGIYELEITVKRVVREPVKDDE